MLEFRPYPGMHLKVGELSFEFVPHPLFPSESETVLVLEGGEAFIYQVREVMTHNLYALKILKPAYRSEHIARVVEANALFAHIHGLYLRNRICLTAANYPNLIEVYPNLAYAVLMPWLTGKTWSGFMLDQAASARYTLSLAQTLAVTLAKLLQHLESVQLAHSDIAGGNIFLSPDLQRLQLLDIEGLYIPAVPPPPFRSQGSPGYQHHNLGPQGQWCPEGDRFAGAILLAEMLTWWNPCVRAQVADNADTLFQPSELQTDNSPRLKEVRKTLLSMHPHLLALFDYAWTSSSLVECPDFASWYSTLVLALR